MAFILPKPSESSGDFETAPEGTHVARCLSIVDMGMQVSTFTDPKTGKPKPPQHKVRLAFELCYERDQQDRPFVVSKQYTVSMHEKASLRKDLESWRGKSFSKEELEAFDLANLVGKSCMVTVKHASSADGTRTYANIAAISGIAKGMQPPPELQGDPLVFTLTDPWNRDALPNWLADRINWGGAQAKPAAAPAPVRQPAPAARPAQQRAPEPVAAGDDFNDDIPF
jgi:hypothetical protein